MNKLPLAKRAHVLTLLCEGMSMRAIARAADVSYPAIDKLLKDAGTACVGFHDRAVRDVKSRRVQCDEIWSFVHAKAKNVPKAKAAPQGGRCLDMDGTRCREQVDPVVGRGRPGRQYGASVDGRCSPTARQSGATND